MFQNIHPDEVEQNSSKNFMLFFVCVLNFIKTTFILRCHVPLRDIESVLSLEWRVHSSTQHCHMYIMLMGEGNCFFDPP
jgi:hypothetical protein